MLYKASEFPTSSQRKCKVREVLWQRAGLFDQEDCIQTIFRNSHVPFPIWTRAVVTKGLTAWVMRTPNPQPDAKTPHLHTPSALHTTVLLHSSCFISGGIESSIILPECR